MGGVPAWGVPAQGGGVSAQGDIPAQGVYLFAGCTCPGGVPIQRGVYLPGGVPAWGVPAQGGVPVQRGVYLPAGGVPALVPPPDRILDTRY